MQISMQTQSTADAYIENREWRDAQLVSCPLHPSGGCSFARHGTYERLTPRGLRIARWYCPEGHQTFSLLPDFLAARFCGLLASIEASISVASSSKSMEAAADVLRGPDVSLPAAVRWLRRRIRAVQAGLDAVERRLPRDLPIGMLAGNLSRRIAFEPGLRLSELRRLLPPQILNCIPAPLGFLPLRWSGWPRDGDQHGMGPDGSLADATVR
jgi:hypothetical protein